MKLAYVAKEKVWEVFNHHDQNFRDLDSFVHEIQDMLAVLNIHGCQVGTSLINVNLKSPMASLTGRPSSPLS
jgi:hypothetical protein